MYSFCRLGLRSAFLNHFLHSFLVDVLRFLRTLRPASDTSAPAAPLREFTLAELAQYNGADPALPIYVSFDGSVHDVSSAPQFYGPQGSYKFFSGRDATRAYLTGCFEPDCLIPDLTDLTEAELATKENFESIYEEKYPRVGILKPEERKVKRIVLLMAQREEERQKKKNGVAQTQVEEKQGGTVYATTTE